MYAHLYICILYNKYIYKQINIQFINLYLIDMYKQHMNPFEQQQKQQSIRVNY